MIKNNNMAVITRMANRQFKNSRRRSITMILSVLLSAFMLFGVLTVGATYFKMERIQNIRLSGAEFDAILYGLTEEQRAVCEKNPDIACIGIRAVAGYVEETEYDSTPNVGLIWADDNAWKKMSQPAVEWVEGEYPRAADEVMVTKRALEKCGLEGLQTGDSFIMTYGTPKGSQKGTFRISGMWDGYGDKSVFYVSQAFYQESGYDPSDVASGRCILDFKQRFMNEKKQEEFRKSLNLGKQQRLFFTGEFANSMQIIGGIAGVMAVTCLCAYLLIYNIMYLSVAANIRYYGLLQTIGMTERQVYQYVLRQMLPVGIIGIAGGILSGCVVDFLMIPAVVKSMGIQSREAGKIMVSFHPVVFLVTVLLTGLTVYFASRKPAKMAVCVSPVEALGYRPAVGSRKFQRTKKGKIIRRLAFLQLTKDKKKSAVVILSLAASLCVFFCMVTLLNSRQAREWIGNYRDVDLIIKNDTAYKENREDRKQLLDVEMLERIEDIKGVKAVQPVICAEIMVPWEPDVADPWMREFYETWMSEAYEDDLEEYKEHPENFGSFLVGIGQEDFDDLNQNLETPIDKKVFWEGKTCLLYRNGLAFQDSDLRGKTVTCAQYADRENTRSFEIAGLIDEGYYCALLGMPPTIIVSENAVKNFIQNPVVHKAGVYYEETCDEETEAEVLALLEQSPDSRDFSWESRIEDIEEVEKAQGSMVLVGFGIIGILAFIGILNYINTCVGSVQSRQVEISVMESIGMTEKQVKRLLISEGIFYAAGAWLVTLTAGMGVTYGLYQSMNYRGVDFQFPMLPVLAAAVLVAVICGAVPVLAYKNLEKRGSLVERIREFD